VGSERCPTCVAHQVGIQKSLDTTAFAAQCLLHPTELVSVTTPTIAVGPIRCGEVGEVIEVLREGVITALAPGRRVMWVVRCPAGRVVRGDVTINAATANRPAAVADHLAYVRSVLLDGHEASTDSASLTEGV